MSTTKKIRSAKCTTEQLSHMIDFMVENKIMILGKLSLNEYKTVEEKWQTLTTILNRKKGAQKTPDQWKKTFIEFKCKTKSKAREIKCEMNKTGGGLTLTKELNNIEEKLMSLIGWVGTTGDPNLPEIGLTEVREVQIVQEFENPVNIEINDANIESVDNYFIPASTSSNQSLAVAVSDIPTNEKGTNVKNTDSIEHPVQQNKNLSKKKPIRRVIKPSDRLHASAQIYSNNSNNLCTAINYLATAINNLALSNNNLAEAYKSK